MVVGNKAAMTNGPVHPITANKMIVPASKAHSNRLVPSHFKKSFTMTPASGEQLAQSRPSGTSAVSVYTASHRTEFTLIVVANTTGTAADFSIYHDDDGSTFNATTALYESVSLAANESLRLVFEVGSGIMVKQDGQIGVKTGTADALTFTFYGTTANIA